MNNRKLAKAQVLGPDSSVAIFIRLNNKGIGNVWKTERDVYDAVMEEVVGLDLQENSGIGTERVTNEEFLDHLLDVHRIWCRSCRPSAPVHKGPEPIHPETESQEPDMKVKEEPREGECYNSESPLLIGALHSDSSKKQVEHTAFRLNPSNPSMLTNVKIAMANNRVRRTEGFNIGQESKYKSIKVFKSPSGSCTFEKLTSIPPSLTHTSTSVTRVPKKLSEELDLLKGASLKTNRTRSVPLLSLPRTLSVGPEDTSNASDVKLPEAESEVFLETNRTRSGPSLSLIAQTLSAAAEDTNNTPDVKLPEAEPEVFPNIDGDLCLTNAGLCQATCVDEDDEEEDDFYDDGTVKFSDVADVPNSSAGAKHKKMAKGLSMKGLMPKIVLPPVNEPLWTLQTGEGGLQDYVDSSTTVDGWVDEPIDMEASEEEDDDDDNNDDDDDDDSLIDTGEPDNEDDIQDTSHDSESSKMDDVSEGQSDQPSREPGGTLKERVRLFAIHTAKPMSVEEADTSKATKDVEDDESGEENRFECIFCDHTCDSSLDMNDHLQSHVPSEPGTFTLDLKMTGKKRKNWNLGWCEDCKKLFMDIASHVRYVHNNESLVCPVCGKVVKYRSYQRHKATHDVIDEKNMHTCKVCLKVFRFKTLLNQHARVHSRKPPKKKFECETCGKIFKHRHRLVKHELIHSDVKPFICSVCGKGFVQHSNLRIHFRQHSGQKPYACEFCDAAFANKVCLKNHKKKLHGVDWWEMNEQKQPKKTELLDTKPDS